MTHRVHRGRGATLFAPGVTAAALVLSVLALGACTKASTDVATAPPAFTQPQIGPIPTITSVEAIPDRPINRYLPTQQGLVAIQLTNTQRINACLFAAGVTDRVTDGADLADFASVLVNDRKARSTLYGFFDVASAGTDGYLHRGSGSDGYAPHMPPTIPAEPLTRCEDAAHAQAGGYALTMEDTKLPSGGPPVPTQDDRYLAVARDWAHCMSQHGLSYADPLAAVTDPQWRGDPGHASPRQIAVATADVECKQQTNLVGVAVAVQAAYDNDYIAQHGQALEGLHYDSPPPPS